MNQISVILGAGFSYIAGLPLTNELLKVNVDTYSNSARKKAQAVQESYEQWCEDTGEVNVEKYLLDLYEDNLLFSRMHIPFSWATSLIAMALATPSKINPSRSYTSPRYSERIVQPTYCTEHTRFWEEVVEISEKLSVITLNYDILAERSLRHQKMPNGFSMGFYYGGFERPQILQGDGSIFYDVPKYVELRENTPIYKLHGSLNWAQENNQLVMYQDMRPAFRDLGAAIVPPVQEKLIPDWLKDTWLGAKCDLEKSSVWIICGYSLPTYDLEIKKLLCEAGQNVETICLLDPYSKELAERWAKVAPNSHVHTLNGLPKGIDEMRDLFKNNNKSSLRSTL